VQNTWIKYSGLAMQFVAFLLAGYWVGGYAAEQLGWNKGSGQVVGMLFFLITGMVKIIRDLLRDSS
jgi:hypothetical protein